ncbi:MAG TPA: 3-deoxy-8-phosphooctulonate synthase [Candidatus Omnitrophica bacterium]|nr:3-deoxy-8-phosphooctulonate synthase [Candidatus Omnitrophota bacterium]
MEKTKEIRIGDLKAGGENALFLIAGPCVIEDEKITLYSAEVIKKVCDKLDIPFIFKSSYDKANRSSIQSFRGVGLKKGLAVLEKVKRTHSVPVLSDVHSVDEAKEAAGVLDIIQIPAFLCRQTDLVVEAAKTGKPINIKKGQFISPWEMKNVIEKIESTGNKNIFLTERGTFFGYNNLVVDMKSIPIMRGFGYPVVFDVTHSLQLPGGLGKSSGGLREFIPYLARAAVACGCDGIFMEVHPQPEHALCDGPNMVALRDLPRLLQQLKDIDSLVRKDP